MPLIAENAFPVLMRDQVRLPAKVAGSDKVVIIVAHQALVEDMGDGTWSTTAALAACDWIRGWSTG